MPDGGWPELVAGDVALRVLRPEDAPAWLAGEDAEQLRWFESPPAELRHVLAAIERWRSGWRDGGPVRHWGVWVGAEIAGGVELRVRDDGRANVSYLVFPDHRGRGLAAAAVRLAAAWAFDQIGVSALVAVVDERNLASRRTAEASGFVPDGPADPSEHGEHGVMVRYLLPRPGSGGHD
jgi:RimJ/RimL family protein N-acetyltransferase